MLISLWTESGMRESHLVDQLLEHVQNLRLVAVMIDLELESPIIVTGTIGQLTSAPEHRLPLRPDACHQFDQQLVSLPSFFQHRPRFDSGP